MYNSLPVALLPVLLGPTSRMLPPKYLSCRGKSPPTPNSGYDTFILSHFYWRMPVPWQVPSNAAAGEPKVGPGLGLDIVAPGLRVHFNSPCCALLVRQPQNNPPPLQWHDQGSARELSSHILSNILNPWIKYLLGPKSVLARHLLELRLMLL